MLPPPPTSCFLSIILPTYNRSKVIGRMIDSILSQSFRDFELLIIDDGSQDNTLEMLKQYQDSRIRVFTQNNSGVSSARNVGIKNARGEYLVFVDSDDFLLEGFFEEISQTLQERDSEILVCNGAMQRPDKTSRVPHFWLKPRMYQDETLDFEGFEFLKLFCLYCGLSWACAKFFKRSLIEKHQILFPEHISYGEDVCFIFKAYFFASKITLQEAPFYICDITRESLSRGICSESHLQNLYQVQNELEEFVKQNKREDLKGYIYTNSFIHGFQHYFSSYFLILKREKYLKQWMMDIACQGIKVEEGKYSVVQRFVGNETFPLLLKNIVGFAVHMEYERFLLILNKAKKIKQSFYGKVKKTKQFLSKIIILFFRLTKKTLKLLGIYDWIKRLVKGK